MCLNDHLKILEWEYQSLEITISVSLRNKKWKITLETVLFRKQNIILSHQQIGCIQLAHYAVRIKITRVTYVFFN